MDDPASVYYHGNERDTAAAGDKGSPGGCKGCSCLKKLSDGIVKVVSGFFYR